MYNLGKSSNLTGGTDINRIGDIYLTFFRIGILTFGGGYTVLPLLQREAAERKNWITQLEVIDYYAVAQCLPGMIGVNSAILIGYKAKGKTGAVAAALGFASPSLLIILLIASLIQNISDLPVVQSAFAGIRVAVCALVVNAIITMAKKAIVNPVTALIAVATFAAAVWLSVNPVLPVICAAVAGIALSAADGSLQRKAAAMETTTQEETASAAEDDGSGSEGASERESINSDKGDADDSDKGDADDSARGDAAGKAGGA